jgi:hypothetical protein
MSWDPNTAIVPFQQFNVQASVDHYLQDQLREYVSREDRITAVVPFQKFDLQKTVCQYLSTDLCKHVYYRMVNNELANKVDHIGNSFCVDEQHRFFVQKLSIDEPVHYKVRQQTSLKVQFRDEIINNMILESTRMLRAEIKYEKIDLKRDYASIELKKSYTSCGMRQVDDLDIRFDLRGNKERRALKHLSHFGKPLPVDNLPKQSLWNAFTSVESSSVVSSQQSQDLKRIFSSAVKNEDVDMA